MVMYQHGGNCARFKMGFPGRRPPVCLLRIGSKHKPTTKVKTHMKKDEQSGKARRTSVKMHLFFVLFLKQTMQHIVKKLILSSVLVLSCLNESAFVPTYTFPNG